MFKSNLRGLLAAVALLIAIPSTALGVTTQATTAETLDVVASLTITGVPATLDYGDHPADSLVASSPLSIVVSTNNASGFAFDVSMTALARSGGGSIAATQRRVDCEMSGTISTFAGAACPAGASDTPYPGGTWAMGSTNASGSATFATTLKIQIPSSAAPGAYSGTVTFTANTNP